MAVASTLRPFVRAVVPRPLGRWLRLAAAWRPPGSSSPTIYERLSDAYGRLYGDDEVVGGRESFDVIGRIELALLLTEGLRPGDTCLDFGCGTGRLAVHAIPYLAGGHYIGVDVSQAMLDKAARRVAQAIPAPPGRVSWIKQTTPVFPFEDHSIDFVCAFSVFTHVEHEDTYRYLRDARRIIRPGGRFVFSCLPMSLAAAQDIFRAEAREDFERRWERVRNVTTSIELMEAIARLAGWTPRRWYAGDEPNVQRADTGELVALGQSACVLEAVAGASPAGEASPLAAGELGRVTLTWSEPSAALVPHFTGPRGDGSGQFQLGLEGDQTGSLAAPPFAALSLDAGGRRATVSVSRLLTGVYHYAVEGPGLAQAGARVTVHHGDTPRPIVFHPPAGSSGRWRVFELEVGPGGTRLRAAETLEPGVGTGVIR